MPDTDVSDGVIDALDGGLIVLTADARISLWNDWMTSATGIETAAAVGKTLSELFPDSPLRRLGSAIDDACTSGASGLLTHALHSRLLPLKTRAGRDLIHDASVRPLGPRPYARCLVQISDVTVAVERERVLRARQNARYAAVVDGAPDAILTIDSDGLIQFANDAAGQAFGCNAGDLMGVPVADLIASQELWIEAWRAALSGDPPRRLELMARRRDGSLSYLEVSASRWLSESRIFVSAIFRDVNERHAADAALRRLNETLEERVAAALAERKVLADMVETTDTLVQVLGQDFRILAINNACADEFERVYGVQPHVGDILTDILAENPAEQAMVRTLWGRALAGEAYTVVQEFGDANLDRRFYEIKFNPLHNAEGVQFAAFQFVYDVTDRILSEEQLVQTEEALRQSQKMEAIGQLTGGIAHDFNNLLTGIIGAMDILRRRLAAGKYEDTQRFMDAATTSANRAAALTHRLLAFARRQPLAPKPVDASQLVRSIEDLLARTLGERVRLETKLEPDLWPMLTDANQLENAVINLAINARDAMPEGGRVTISTEKATLAAPLHVGQDEIQAGDYTVIRVKDTGTGIAPEAIDRVFEPFFTTKPLGEGTGLGLSMIYGFVKQSRGAVQIESNLGEGAQFSLYLPRYHGPWETTEGKRHRAPPEGHGETVLLVEDDSSVRLLIGEVLRDLGYACIEASDGKTALPVLSSNTRLDLMITDVGLPGLDGRQLASHAREHRPDLNILFVTGYAERFTDGADFLEPGMELVTKPFTLDALAFKIREMLAAPKE